MNGYTPKAETKCTICPKPQTGHDCALQPTLKPSLQCVLRRPQHHTTSKRPRRHACAPPTRTPRDNLSTPSAAQFSTAPTSELRRFPSSCARHHRFPGEARLIALLSLCLVQPLQPTVNVEPANQKITSRVRNRYTRRASSRDKRLARGRCNTARRRRSTLPALQSDLSNFIRPPSRVLFSHSHDANNYNNAALHLKAYRLLASNMREHAYRLLVHNAKKRA